MTDSNNNYKIKNSNSTAIIFPGQGSQKLNMGKDLYDNFTYVREKFDIASDILSKDLSKIIFGEDNLELTKTENAQPSLMLISACLLEVMKREYDIDFNSFTSLSAGHSLGEYSALYFANIFSFSDSIELLKIRSNAMAEAAKENKGSMAALIGFKNIDNITNKLKELSDKYNKICVVANDNSPNQIVISGDEELINIICNDKNLVESKRVVKLDVAGAFHSPLMKSAQISMSEILHKINFNEKAKFKIISNVDLSIFTNKEQVIDLLTKQITSKVRWRETMEIINNNNIENIIEIGSLNILSNLFKKTYKNKNTISISNLNDINLIT